MKKSTMWTKVLLISCVAHMTLQATIPTRASIESMYHNFLQDLGMRDKQFKLPSVSGEELQNRAKEFLMTIQPKNKLSAKKPSDSSLLQESNPLVNYNSPEIIRYYGYTVEIHHVTTKDGYDLEIHRIPFGKNTTEPGKRREPVILQHGLLSSSADWVMNHPEQGFAFLLADAGYDVWLPNVRGNTYSKTNTHFSNEDKEFWEFSWNQIGVFDMPCIIDHVLSSTGFSQVYYAGHSMGTTMFFVLMDKYPEYNEKVRAFFALAPVVTVDNMKSPIKVLAPIIDYVYSCFELMGFYEFLPSNEIMKLFAATFCEDNEYTQYLCKNILFILAGYNPKQTNTTMLPAYLSHMPAGASTKTLIHYGQIIGSAIFRNFDYGEDNEKIYGTDAPPAYDLSKTTVDTYFYWGENDWLADPKDVKEAETELPNLKLSHRVEDEDWTHLDFLWGIQANKLLYEKIIKEMSTMNIDLTYNMKNTYNEHKSRK